MPLALGALTLRDSIFYAPLAGCSDFPFRAVSAEYQPALMFCEMVKMEAVVRRVPVTMQMLAYNASMRPIGAQLCGSNPALAKEAAQIIEDLGFDALDYNCGCPVDKVTKDGSGSGMLKHPEQIGEMLALLTAAVRIPVTVKIRAGWDADAIVAPEVTRIAEQAGAKAIFVHGRTREQGYHGPANWDYIRACKEVATHILVIGNGDIFSPQDALRMQAYTGCDGVLVSRGTLGQPWIAEHIRALQRGETPPKVTPSMARSALLHHFSLSSTYKSEKGALIDMRKVCCWYLKEVPHARAFREKASHAQTLVEVHQLIETFDWGDAR